MTTLVIGSVEVPFRAGHAIEQTYTEVMPQSFKRTADNSGILRTSGTAKLRTVIRGQGWIPPGLAGLDIGQTHVIKGQAPREVASLVTSIALPASRRHDSGHTPIAWAIVDGRPVETAITNKGDIDGGASDLADLVAVAGAASYMVLIWPEFTAAILANSCQADNNQATRYRWDIEAEEV